MRKVKLTMKEEIKYLTIKKLVETNGNKKRASVKLDCTIRHINRIVIVYKRKGSSLLEEDTFTQFDYVCS